MRISWIAALLLLLALPARAEIPVGDGRIEVPEPSGATAAPLPVWLHRAAAWQPGGPVLVVMHGLRRDADHYRDDWAALAERYGVLLLVPEFSHAKYPGAAWYNFGGAVDDAGVARPREAWSFFALDRAVAAVQRAAGAPEGPFVLYGHSAGAQFVHRYLLLTGARRAGTVVIANAGSYTLPVFDRDFPEGLRGPAVTHADLGAALSRPVVMLLGEADIDPNHPSLPRQPWAMAQGPYRFARGQNFLRVAREAAAGQGVAFGWRLVTVPGVGHSNAGMAEAAAAALFGR